MHEGKHDRRDVGTRRDRVPLPRQRTPQTRRPGRYTQLHRRLASQERRLRRVDRLFALILVVAAVAAMAMLYVLVLAP